MRYFVDISNQAREYFESIEDAISYSTSLVYLKPDRMHACIDTINQGQVFSYCYGFISADIGAVNSHEITCQACKALGMACLYHWGTHGD